MINNKGLTLVELLAAIAIMGIMSGVAVIAVNGVLQNSKEKYYASLRSNIIVAAKSYYADHRGLLPKLNRQRKLSVQTLVNNKYIEKPIAHDKKSSCVENSVITVTKVSKDKYEYSIDLHCQNISEDLTNGKN